MALMYRASRDWHTGYIFGPTRINVNFQEKSLAIGGSKGGARNAPSPGVQILSFSCSFWRKKCKIISIWELAHPLGKILDPPLLAELTTGKQSNKLNPIRYMTKAIIHFRKISLNSSKMSIASVTLVLPHL